LYPETKESDVSNFTDKFAHMSLADLSVSNFTDEFTQMRFSYVAAAPFPNYDDTFNGYAVYHHQSFVVTMQ
jgi:hypothetical protein